LKTSDSLTSLSSLRFRALPASFRVLLGALLLGGLSGTSASCMNPVHSDAVAALGDEAQGVRTGPTHRPGQPCLVCHGGDGPGPDFAMAGTVYEKDGSIAPSVNTEVVLTDATGSTRTEKTNSVGNFYIQSGRWTPTYPVDVVVQRDGVKQAMQTRIGRQTACATCHKSGGSSTSVAAVYLNP
jgi:hypothetical protein